MGIDQNEIKYKVFYMQYLKNIRSCRISIEITLSFQICQILHHSTSTSTIILLLKPRCLRVITETVPTTEITVRR
jgi:hypothetical protein